MDVALVELQHNAKTITLSFFTEDSSRHTGLGQVRTDGVDVFNETANTRANVLGLLRCVLCVALSTFTQFTTLAVDLRGVRGFRDVR